MIESEDDRIQIRRFRFESSAEVCLSQLSVPRKIMRNMFFSQGVARFHSEPEHKKDNFSERFRDSKEPGVYEWTLTMMRFFLNRAVSRMGSTETARVDTACR